MVELEDGERSGRVFKNKCLKEKGKCPDVVQPTTNNNKKYRRAAGTIGLRDLADRYAAENMADESVSNPGESENEPIYS